MTVYSKNFSSQCSWLDPGDLKGGLQTLYENLASSEQVQQFLQDAKEYEVSISTSS
jgi:hypothetical protein